MKTIKDSLCYSNNQVLKYIRENLNDIEYDETETNNFLYEIQRDKGGFINKFNNYSKIHNFGEIIDIIVGFKFKIKNMTFDIFDLKLDDYKIYRFLFI